MFPVVNNAPGLFFLVAKTASDGLKCNHCYLSSILSTMCFSDDKQCIQMWPRTACSGISMTNADPVPPPLFFPEFPKSSTLLELPDGTNLLYVHYDAHTDPPPPTSNWQDCLLGLSLGRKVSLCKPWNWCECVSLLFSTVPLRSTPREG